MGRIEDAQRHMRDSIPGHLRDNEPRMLVVLAEDHEAVLAELGQYQRRSACSRPPRRCASA
jgi:hypothetical protein